MANTAYTRALQGFLAKELDMDTDAIKATLIDSADYTFSAAHTTYATDVAGAAKVAASSALGSPTVTNGVFDSADFTWTAVTGDQCEAVILWNDTPAAPVADPLLIFYDTSMTGMPVTPSGGDINFTVNASGWFAL